MDYKDKVKLKKWEDKVVERQRAIHEIAPIAAFVDPYWLREVMSYIPIEPRPLAKTGYKERIKREQRNPNSIYANPRDVQVAEIQRAADVLEPIEAHIRPYWTREVMSYIHPGPPFERRVHPEMFSSGKMNEDGELLHDKADRKPFKRAVKRQRRREQLIDAFNANPEAVGEAAREIIFTAPFPEVMNPDLLRIRNVHLDRQPDAQLPPSWYNTPPVYNQRSWSQFANAYPYGPDSEEDDGYQKPPRGHYIA